MSARPRFGLCVGRGPDHALASVPNRADGSVDELMMREEMARMREHVMPKADTDGDGLVSEAEFVALTQRPDFNSNDSWHALFVCGR